jgi:hypothetical protein
MSTASRRIPTFAMFLAAFAVSAANAQDVQYSTVTKVDLGGALNAMARLAGVSETKETSYIKGKKFRTDGEKSSVIFDLDNSRYILLDHDAKTYMSVALADMAAVATSAMRGMKADASKDQLKGTAVDSAGNKADFIVDLKVEPTKERRSINGNDAERVLVTMETNVHVTPQGQTASEEAGTLVVLMDSWNANTGPAADVIRAFEQTASKEVAAAAFGRRSNMGAALGANPQMADAMKKAQEEAQKVDGIEVLSTTHLVIVAPGKKFDRNLALKGAGGVPGETGAPEKKRGGLRGMIGKAIESSRQPQQEEQKAAEDQTQGTLAKVTTELREVKTTSLPASLFEIPAGYREVKPQTTR